MVLLDLTAKATWPTTEKKFRSGCLGPAANQGMRMKDKDVRSITHNSANQILKTSVPSEMI